jgi:two-component system, OmpR family, sensor histidine kinase KdpD
MWVVRMGTHPEAIKADQRKEAAEITDQVGGVGSEGTGAGVSAGINVITAVNIQHLESIADDVERMTGTPVRERVPDRVAGTRAAVRCR